jgi:hypothetical protein
VDFRISHAGLNNTNMFTPNRETTKTEGRIKSVKYYSPIHIRVGIKTATNNR